MATTNIELDIENITGVSDADDQFIVSAQKFVVASIPKDLLKWAASETVSGSHGGDNSPTAITLPVGTDNIIAVRRDSYNAKEVGLEDRAWLESSSGSLKIPTASFPKYYITAGNQVRVKPDPTVSLTAHVTYVDYSKIDDDCDVRNAVVFHACAKEFTQLATSTIPTWSDVAVPIAPTAPDFGNDLTISSVVPVSPSSPSFDTGAISVSSSSPAYTKPVFSAPSLGSVGSLNLPSVPSIPVLDTTTVSFSTSAPTYTKPVLSLNSAPSISNLNISVIAPVPPSSPSISGGSVASVTVGSHLTSAPSYTSPTTTISGVAWATEYPDTEVDITTPLAAIVTNVDLANAVIDSPPVPPDSISDTIADFSLSGQFDDGMLKAKALIDEAGIGGDTEPETAQYWLNDEDSEMVAATVQVASQELQRANLGLQDALQTFNTDVQKFQASGIGKFSAEVQQYQAEVSEMSARAQGYIQAAQGYANEVQTRLSSTQVKVSEYQIRVQDALNEFNEDNAIYQAAIQTNIQQSQIDTQDAQKEADLTLQASLQDYTLELQLFQQKIANYQAQVNDEVQEYQQNLQGDLQVWQIERQTDLEEYTLNIQNELNEFNKEMSEYQTQLQVSLKNADLSDASDTKSLEKYKAELNSYQAESNNVIQEWIQEEWNLNFLKYQNDYGILLQTYQSDIQNELNEFNKEQTVFQNELQEKIQEGTNQQNKDVQEYSAKLQKYSNELQSHQSDVNTEIQDFTNTLSKEVQEYQSKVALYTADLQKYQAEVASETQKTGLNSQKAQVYAVEADKYYKWAVTEVQSYVQNNSKMIGMQMASQSTQQQRR